MFWNQGLGKKGEELAATWLKNQGFKLIDHGFRSRYGEIDLIAVQKQTLYFCEVKTRSNLKHGTPYEALTLLKRRHLRLCSIVFLQRHPQYQQKYQLRYAAIGILLQGNAAKIELKIIEEI